MGRALVSSVKKIKVFAQKFLQNILQMLTQKSEEEKERERVMEDTEHCVEVVSVDELSFSKE